MKSLTALIAILAIALIPIQQARAQVDPFTVETVTTSTTAVGAATTATVTSDTLSVRGSEGIGFMFVTKLSGTGTAGVTFAFDVSADGTTWTTNQPFTTGAVAATGTTSVVSFVNFSPDDAIELRNIQYIRLSKVTNANTPSTLTIESLQSTKYNR